MRLWVEVNSSRMKGSDTTISQAISPLWIHLARARVNSEHIASRTSTFKRKDKGTHPLWRRVSRIRHWILPRIATSEQRDKACQIPFWNRAHCQKLRGLKATIQLCERRLLSMIIIKTRRPSRMMAWSNKENIEGIRIWTFQRPCPKVQRRGRQWTPISCFTTNLSKWAASKRQKRTTLTIRIFTIISILKRPLSRPLLTSIHNRIPTWKIQSFPQD